MIDKNIIGSGIRTMKPDVMRPAVMPSTFVRPQTGSGPLSVHRAPLKFNY